MNVAIPSSRAARARELERLPSPASVIHSRQNSSAQYLSASATATLTPRLSAASLQPNQKPNSTLPASPNGPPSPQHPGQDRAIHAASSGTSSSVQPIGFPQTLTQIARTWTPRRQPSTLSGLRFRVPPVVLSSQFPHPPGPTASVPARAAVSFAPSESDPRGPQAVSSLGQRQAHGPSAPQARTPEPCPRQPLLGGRLGPHDQ